MTLVPPPLLAEMIPSKVRLVVYILSAMLAPAYAVAEASTNLHWGVLAAYAAWTGFVGALAAANTSKVPDIGHQAAGGDEVA